MRMSASRSRTVASATLTFTRSKTSGEPQTIQWCQGEHSVTSTWHVCWYCFCARGQHSSNQHVVASCVMRGGHWHQFGKSVGKSECWCATLQGFCMPVWYRAIECIPGESCWINAVSVATVKQLLSSRLRDESDGLFRMSSWGNANVQHHYSTVSCYAV